MICAEFKQLNLKSVIDRANDILVALRELNFVNGPDIIRMIAIMTEVAEGEDDEWEVAALKLVRLEILERNVRIQDKTTESAPPGWNGGIN